MKKTACRQPGGACDAEFVADSFEKMAELSQQHGKEMLQKGDPDHLKAMEKMRMLMQDPEAMGRWFREKQQEFDDLPGIE